VYDLGGESIDRAMAPGAAADRRSPPRKISFQRAHIRSTSN
jgi:hypothetical protein